MIDYSKLEAGQRYTVVDGRAVKQKTRSNRGLVIEGEATLYDSVLYESGGRYINIQSGAFDVSIKHEPPVRLWLDHDAKLAMPGVRVELYSDERALSFRAHLDDSELAFHARDLVECESYSQVSLGFHSSKTITRDVEGKQLVYVVQAILTEVSLLPAAACATTHCQVSELKQCRTLREDVESKKFHSDNDFIAIRRAFQRMTDE